MGTLQPGPPIPPTSASSQARTWGSPSSPHSPPTSDTSANTVGSAFRIYPRSAHLLPPITTHLDQCTLLPWSPGSSPHLPDCPPHSRHQRAPVSTQVRPHTPAHLPLSESRSPPHGPATCPRPLPALPSPLLPLFPSLCSSHLGRLTVCPSQVRSCPRVFALAILPICLELPGFYRGSGPCHLLQEIFLDLLSQSGLLCGVLHTTRRPHVYVCGLHDCCCPQLHKDRGPGQLCFPDPGLLQRENHWVWNPRFRISE